MEAALYRVSVIAGRGVALFLGVFTVLNVLGEAVSSGFDANEWWIDLRPLPLALSGAALLAGGALLCAWGGAGWLRRPTRSAAGLLMVIALLNAARFWVLLARGEVASDMPVPMSLLIAAALGMVVVAAGRQPRAGRPLLTAMGIATMVLLCAVLFPVAQMFCFGLTDYRRPADAIVVFGARAYADGRCSDALGDRVREACGLYRAGLAPVVIMSGGPGDGSVHETEAMAALAQQLGVPREAIVLDREGVNTPANTAAALGRTSRVLAVSHFYHMPRVRLAYQRQGMRVCTVPATQTYILRRLPMLIGREIPALWVYYLLPGWR